jgi:hypothetical protein
LIQNHLIKIPMKKLFILLLLTSPLCVFSQSGTIEPTGFYIPNVLSLPTCNISVKGKMVFLSTNSRVYFCDGTLWQSTLDISLPLSKTSTSSSDLFRITNTGTGGSIYAGISNTTNNDYAIYGISDGTGAAGRFYNQNASGHALQTVGKLSFSMASMGDGKVLTSDANGNATWKAGPRHEVAFAAYGLVPIAPGYNEQSYPGSTYSKIRFKTENYDLGSNLNSSVFTAPYHGIYHFDLLAKFVGTYDLDGDWYNLSLWKDDSDNVAQLFAGHNYYGSIQLSTDVILAAGQTITAKFYTNAPSGEYGWLYTDDHLARFTGHIITRLD